MSQVLYFVFIYLFIEIVGKKFTNDEALSNQNVISV